MNTSLTISIIGGAIYIIGDFVENDSAIFELGRLAFWVGLLAYLFGR